MYPEEDPLDVLISAIESFSYCPRQCGLVHLEQTWEENLFTIRGQLAHERVDAGGDTVSAGIRTSRDVPLWSRRHGLRGKADLVEFRPAGPFPVEYKVGPRRGAHADLQLCAQALCLEEMLDVVIPAGALFSYSLRRRFEVEFTAALRETTIRMVGDIRSMLATQRLPPAPNDARCPNCALINACIPWVVSEPDRIRGLQGALFQPMSLPDA